MKLNKKGFTLIELVVVMAIIAVLSLLIIAAITAARRQSVVTTNKGNARTVEVAMETFASNNGGKYLNLSGTNLSAVKAAGLTTLTTEVTGSCANGGGTITSSDTTFTITIVDWDCTTALSPTIVH